MNDELAMTAVRKGCGREVVAARSCDGAVAHLALAERTGASPRLTLAPRTNSCVFPADAVRPLAVTAGFGPVGVARGEARAFAAVFGRAFAAGLYRGETTPPPSARGVPHMRSISLRLTASGSAFASVTSSALELGLACAPFLPKDSWRQLSTSCASTGSGRCATSVPRGVAFSGDQRAMMTSAPKAGVRATRHLRQGLALTAAASP